MSDKNVCNGTDCYLIFAKLGSSLFHAQNSSIFNRDQYWPYFLAVSMIARIFSGLESQGDSHSVPRTKPPTSADRHGYFLHPTATWHLSLDDGRGELGARRLDVQEGQGAHPAQNRGKL